MGLIYVSSESSELMNAMKANISTGKEVTNQLKSGSQKIISAVDGRTLSGAAYTAGKGLFSELIVPTIDKVTSAIDELETELTTYNTADSKVSDEGTLDEDRLRDKIATKKAMKQAVDISAAVVKGAFQDNTAAKILESLLQVQCTLNKMSNAFETDIDELQKKLEKLQQFSSETSNLFSNSLSTMKVAMQAVTILSKTIVYPDGSYQLPPGIVPDWFKELKKPDKAESSDKDKQPDVGNREYKLIDLGYGKIMMWVEKGKTSATPDDIDVTLKYNEWLSRMIDKHGISFIQGEHQEDFLELFLRQNITLLKEIETGIDSTTGKELTTQEKLLKMTTLANSMLTAGVAIKGVIDVGKTSTSKSTIRKKKASEANIPKPNVGVVQSRINVANGSTRFSSSENAGFNHVLDRHFNPNRNAGQFTISQDKLRNILSNKNTVNIPVREIPGNQFERIVDIGETAGTIKPSIPDIGGTPTNYIRIITDKAGNLITTYPIPKP